MAKSTGPYEHATLSFSTTGHGTTVEVTLNLTYESFQTTHEANVGSYHVVAATGTYTVLNKDGSVKVVHPITMIQGRGRVGANNNFLYLGTGKEPFPYAVDKHGISFQIDDPTRAYPHQTERFNFFHSAQGAGYQLYTRFQNRHVSKASVQVSTSSTTTTSAEPLTSEAAAAAPVCYASGTRIRTSRGDLAVETLVVGDLVVTASGELRPIRWLGHRTIECRRHPRPDQVLPVRIAAHAFGAGLPARDLLVSPGHAICVDAMGEVLIPAAALVNGTTIVQVEVERVTYWHVELDAHDIVLAENLPAESYIDMGNRGFFAESRTVALAAIPDTKPATHADFCRPFHGDGPVVEAVRAWLMARAAGIAATEEDVRAA